MTLPLSWATANTALGILLIAFASFCYSAEEDEFNLYYVHNPEISLPIQPSSTPVYDENDQFIGFDMEAYGNGIDEAREFSFLTKGYVLGDFDIACRVEIDAYYTEARAGLMAVQTTGNPPDEPIVIPSRGTGASFMAAYRFTNFYSAPFQYGMQYRTASDNHIDLEWRIGSAQWVRIKRQGSIFTSFIGFGPSKDAITWSQIGTESLTYDNASYYIGMFATAESRTIPATARFRDFHTIHSGRMVVVDAQPIDEDDFDDRIWLDYIYAEGLQIRANVFIPDNYSVQIQNVRLIDQFDNFPMTYAYDEPVPGGRKYVYNNTPSTLLQPQLTGAHPFRVQVNMQNGPSATYEGQAYIESMPYQIQWIDYTRGTFRETIPFVHARIRSVSGVSGYKIFFNGAMVRHVRFSEPFLTEREIFWQGGSPIEGINEIKIVATNGFIKDYDSNGMPVRDAEGYILYRGDWYSESRTFEIDLNGPQLISVFPPAGGYYNKRTVLPSGTYAEVAFQLSYTIDGETFLANQLGALFLNEGEHSVTEIVEDGAGNRGGASWSFHVDLTPPLIKPISPLPGQTVSIHAPISFQVTDALAGVKFVTAQIDGIEIPNVPAGGLSNLLPPLLSHGPHTLIITAEDNTVGFYEGDSNRSEQVISFFVDAEGPWIQVHGSDTAGLTVPTGARILFGEVQGDAMDVRVVSPSLPGVELFRTPTASAQTFSIEFAANEPGSYPMQIIAEDLLGNITEKSLVVNVVLNVDSDGDLVPDEVDGDPEVADSPPGISLSRPLEGEIFNKAVNGLVAISGEITNDDSVILIVYADNDIVHTSSVGAGPFSIEVPVVDGIHSIRVLAKEDEFRQARSPQRSVVVDTREPAHIEINTPKNAISYPIWAKGHVQDQTPHATGILSVEIGGKKAALQGAGDPNVKFGWIAPIYDLNSGPAQVADRAANAASLYLFDLYNLSENPASLVVNKNYRIAIQEGDTLITNVFPQEDVGTYEARSVATDGSTVVPPVILHGEVSNYYYPFYYTAYCDKGYLPYPATGTDFDLQFDVYADDDGRFIGTATGMIDVYRLRILPAALKVKGTTGELPVPVSIPAEDTSLAQFLVHQPMRGDVPGLGNCTLTVYAAGKAVGMGDARIWYDPNSAGIPAPETQLVPYTGHPIPVSAISPLTGKAFYVQGILKSTFENDVSIVLEYEPLRTEGYDYKKTCTQLLPVTVEDVSARLLVDANHDGEISRAGDPPYQTPRFGALFIRGFGYPNQLEYHERVRVKLDLDEGFAAAITLKAGNKYTGIYEMPAGGTPLFTEGERTWTPPEKPPEYVWVEFPADDQVTLELISGTRKLDELKINVFTNGLGADSMSPTATVLPNSTSINLNTGNVFFFAAKETFRTPIPGPSLTYSYNLLDGFDRGNGRGWRSNYDVQLFDGSADLNRDGTHELSERVEGDWLIVIDETGRRFSFRYSMADQKFISEASSGWRNAEVLPPEPGREFYELRRFDNHRLYLNLNGLLTRIERSDGYELAIEFQENDQVSVVKDMFERRAVGVPLVLGPFNMPAQLSGGQLPAFDFVYELSQDPVKIPRLKNLTLSGESSAIPVIAEGPDGKSFNQGTGSVTLILDDFEDRKNRPRRATLGEFSSVFGFGEGTASAQSYSGGTLSVNFLKHLDAWEQMTTPGGIQISRDLDQSIRRVMIESKGQQVTSFNYDNRGYMSSLLNNAGPSWTRKYFDIPNKGVHLLENETIAGVGVTRYTYEHDYWVKSVINPENESTTFSYGAPGFLLTRTDSRNFTWSYSNHTFFGDHRSSSSPMGRSTSRTLLESYGLQTSVTDWMNYTYSTVYDARHRVVAASKPGASALTAYDLFDRVVGAVDYSGTYVLQSRDTLGRVTGVVQPSIGDRSITYSQDVTGITAIDRRQGGQGVPNRRLSTTIFDFDGRVVQTSVPIVLSQGGGVANAVTAYRYTPEGWLEVVDDPRHAVTTTSYDLGARQILVERPNGGIHRTQYDEAWRVVSVTLPDGETSYSSYDGANRVVQTINPAGGVVKSNYSEGVLESLEVKEGENGGLYGLPEFHDYDNDGLLIHKTDRLGLHTTLDIQSRAVTATHDNSALRSSTAHLDANTNVNMISTALGNTHLTPAPDGFITSVIAPNRNAYSQSRDGLNRITNVGLPTGGSSSVQFHPVSGDVTTSTNVLNLTTTFSVAPQTGDFNTAVDNVEGVDSPPIATVVLRDRNGNIRQYLDSMQRLWMQEFDDENQRERLISPDGIVTRFTYTLGGKLASVRDTRGITTYKYHPLGLVNEIVDASQRTTTREFDSFGQLLRETRGSEVSTVELDSVTKLVKATSKGSSRVEYFRDRYGRTERLRDSQGNEYVYEFDDADRVLKITYPDQKFESYEYQPNGPDIVAMVDRAGRRTEVGLDGAGRIEELRHLTPTGAEVVQYSYNAASQVTGESLNGVSVGRSYDGRGRLRSVAQPTGAVAYDYFNDNQVQSSTGPAGPNQYFYNAAGRLERMTAPGGDAGMTYDDKGRLETLSLPHGVSRRYVYGQAGRITRMEQTSPGAAGPVTEAHTYRYDGEGRLIRVGTPGGNFRYAYDGEGRLVEEVRVWSEPYSTRYTYDSNGNRTAVERFETAETKTYNMNGTALPSGATIQAGEWAVADGFLSSAGAGFTRLNLVPVRDTSTLYQVRVLVIATGIVEGEERRAGVTFGASTDGRYGAYFSVRMIGGVLMQRVKIYHRDALGAEVLLKESGEREHTDGYWTLEVLVSDIIQARVVQDTQAITLVRVASEFEVSGAVALEAAGTHEVIGVSYDHFRWQAYTEASRQWNYAYNTFNQLMSISGAETATFSYNAMGQMAQRVQNGVQTDYAYDRLGRTTSVTAPGLAQNFGYSGSSWMRQTSTLNDVTTSYLYDGHNCVAQTTSGVTTRYAFLGSKPLWESADATTQTYLDDGRGNVGGLAGATGLLARFSYDAYGRMKSYAPSGALTANTNGPRYRGEHYDAAIDQAYLRYRQYDPNLGRFTTPDPKGMVDGPNLYAYCGGDPVNYIDPMGTEIEIAGVSQDSVVQNLDLGPITVDRYLLRAMLNSKNVYKANSWEEMRSLIRNGDNADWIVKDLGTTWTALFGEMASDANKRIAQDAYISQWKETGFWTNARESRKLDWDDRQVIKRYYELQFSLEYAADVRGQMKLGATPLEAHIVSTMQSTPIARMPFDFIEASGADGALSTRGHDLGRELEFSDRLDRGGAFLIDAVTLVGPKLIPARTPTTGLVGYAETDLGRIAAEYRLKHGVSPGLDVAVYEFIDNQGALRTFVRETGGGHAERVIGRKLQADGISLKNVTRVYSELEPCVIPGGRCKQFLAREIPQAAVSYSFEYGASKASREAGMKALQDMIKLFKAENAVK